jgi:hypothetical protein
MSTIKKNEIYRHVSGFLQKRGIELKDGALSRSVQQGCTLLTETVNLAQSTLSKVKSKVDVRLDRMRQTIHERTAPTTNAPGAATGKSSKAKPKSPRKSARKKSTKAKGPTAKT